MTIARLLRQSAMAVGAVIALVGFQAQPASAQLFWDWGGGSIVGGSGREVVRFSPQYPKGRSSSASATAGSIIVTKPGEAHAAIPSPFRASRAAGRA